jgi:hypothetical protein
MTVAQTKPDNLARELVRLLNEMSRLHDELTALMRDKLEAMRRADSNMIESITARESVLAGRLAEREGLRRDLVRNILRGLGTASRKPQTVRMTELAECFAEPTRSQILVATTGLRVRLEEIERISTTTRMITTEMLRHMGAIIEVMTSGGPATGVYSRAGGRETSGRANVFEAVG